MQIDRPNLVVALPETDLNPKARPPVKRSELRSRSFGQAKVLIGALLSDKDVNMINRRNLVQLLAVAPVAAALPAVASADDMREYQIAPEPFSKFAPKFAWSTAEHSAPSSYRKVVRNQVLGPGNLFFWDGGCHRYEIRDSDFNIVGAPSRAADTRVVDGDSPGMGPRCYAGFTVPDDMPYGPYIVRFRREAPHIEDATLRSLVESHTHDQYFKVVDASLYSVWYASNAGKFVIASSAEDAALQYHNWFGWRDGDLHLEEWEQWPADKAFAFTEGVGEAEAMAAREASKSNFRDYLASDPRPGSYVDFPGRKDEVWLYGGERWPEDRKYFPEVIWHVPYGPLVPYNSPEARNLIWRRETRMLPAQWVVKLGPGYIGSTEV